MGTCCIQLSQASVAMTSHHDELRFHTVIYEKSLSLKLLLSGYFITTRRKETYTRPKSKTKNVEEEPRFFHGMTLFITYVKLFIKEICTPKYYIYCILVKKNLPNIWFSEENKILFAESTMSPVT